MEVCCRVVEGIDKLKFMI